MTTTALNAAIAKAVAAGKSSYSLPAKVVLDAGQSLVIPTGAKNFALLGRAGGTTITAKGNVGYAIVCGIQAGWDLSPLRGRGASPIEMVEDGSTELVLLGSQAVSPGDYLALMSRQWITHTGGTDSQCNECELTRVVKVDGKRVTLDRPTCREYTLEPSVSVVTDLVSSGVSIKGVTFNAEYAGGRNSGLALFGLVDGLEIKDCETRDFGSRACQFNVCRDGKLTRVHTIGGANISNPGSGYGPTFMRCRDVEIVGCVSEDTRHGFMATNGSCRFLYRDCQSLGPSGNFDSHGFDERDITYLRCKATAFNVGNTAYLAGAKRTTLLDCEVGTLLVSANTDATTVLNSRMTNLAWQSVPEDKKARPSSGRAMNVLIKNTAIDFIRSFTSERGDIDGLVIEGCPIRSGTDDFTQLMTLKWVTGSITFRNCQVAMNGKGVYPPIALTQTNPSFSLTLENFTLRSKAALWTAVQLGKDFKGSLVARGYEVKSARPTTVFLENLSTAKADLSLPLVTP